jgi:hypothetical protein
MSEPRATATIYVDCCAPAELIGDNPDPVVIENCRDMLPIPCEGNGEIGTWCGNCSFAEIEVEDD